MPSLSRRLVAALTCVLARQVCAAADAPAVADTAILDRVEVVANRQPNAEAPPPSPQPGYTIDADTLRQSVVVNTEDALKFAPNLHVRKRYVGDNNGIVSVRSTSTRQSARTLVYADGLLLSNLLGSDFSFPPRWSMVAPSELARVDVLYGPYSARYPGNSLGATVLLTTRMPSAFEASANTQIFNQDYAHNGVDRSFAGFRAGASIGSRSGAWSYRIDIDHLDNDGQPLSFYTALQSTTPAQAGDIAIDGAVPWADQRGRPGYLFGINSEGLTHTRNDQLKFKLGWDIAPEIQATLTAVDWRQVIDHETASYLRDVNGQAITSGPVAIDGFRYIVPANAFAPSDSDSHRRLYGLSLRSAHETGWNYAVTASKFDVGSDRSRTANTPGNGPGTITFGDETGWSTFDAIADYTPAALESLHAVAVGVHIDRYALENETFDTADWRSNATAAFNNAFAGRTRTQAAFIEDRWTFIPNWTLVPGLRFEHWSADQGRRAQGDVELAYPARSESTWSPKLALERAFASDWTARLSLGRAVRFPTVSELFQGRITGTTIVNNDPSLKPEDSFSKDLTFERVTGDTQLRITLYEDDVRDALFSQTNTTIFPNVTSIQNVDRVRTRGAEIAWESRNVFVEGFDLAASIARNRAITLRNDNFPDSEGKYFYRIPDWRADLGVTWHFTPDVNATVAARYSGRQYNTLDNVDTYPRTFGGTSHYFVVDAKVNVDVGEHVSLGFGVENLNDEEYYVYHPYPGRTWVAEATVRY
jgi:iron complex outermembrane recepter protein